MIADIALPIPVGKCFSYTVPDEIAPYISIWSRVRVPFRQKDAVGIVAGLREGDGTGLKSIIEPLDFFPPVSDELAALAGWASSFYLTPVGLVMKYALPPVRDIERYLLAGDVKEGPSATDSIPLPKIIKKSGRIRLFQRCRENTLVLRDNFTHKEFTAASSPGPKAAPRPDDAEQTVLVDSLEGRLERYVSLIDKQSGENGNTLFLLPDHYAAGAYFTQRLKAVYGDRVVWFTSGIPVKQRMETYFRVRRDGGHIVLGNKSAVFLPVHNLSLIIVDRFDDDEYRNEEGFKFNAARTAIERARLKDISITLGSAACSVDILHHARKTGIRIECDEWLLRSKCHDNIKTIGSGSSGELLDRLAGEVAGSAGRGENIAIYVPRKGFGSYLRCHACREDLTCTKCGGSLGYDRDKDTLYCSDCGAGFPYVDACPACGSSMIGFTRTGASFIHDHLCKVLPSIESVLITGDSLKKELSVLGRDLSHAARCFVGTQALSKLYGYHVDRLFLVGWEELRKMSGFRSEEKTHQVISNLIDALTPDEIVSFTRRKQAVDIAPYLQITGFYETELQKRREADFPPVTSVFLIQVRAKTKAGADRAMARITALISGHGLDPFMFGSMPGHHPPFYSWKIVLKGPEDILANSLEHLYDIPGVEIEADPPNF